MIKGSICNPVTNTFINMDTIYLAIGPYPIKAEGGNTINFLFEVDVLKEIEKGAMLEVTMKKDEWILDKCIHFVSMIALKLNSKTF